MSKKPQTYKYLFGPVISRRYGLSLGVDLAVPKTCSFNCLFCQIGETAQTTVVRQSLPSVKEILRELQEWVDSGAKTDFITVAGSGEPTLHRNFGEVLSFTRNETAFRSLLLSNGSLFFLEDVRNQAKVADVVKLSLHAWNQSSFLQITRAAPVLNFENIIDGYRRFRDIYTGQIDLEVFVVPGLNDRDDQMEKIAAIARRFSPDSIYLNSAVRPPADSSVKEAPPDLIDKLSAIFGSHSLKRINVDAVEVQAYSPATLVKLLSRHPASLNQLVKQFNLPYDVILTELKELEQQKLMKLSEREGEIFALPISVNSE